jgi:copper transport protein
VLAAFLALAATAQVTDRADAHADLVTAEPTPNGSVLEAPERLRLSFTEAVDPGTVAIQVLDAQGRRVTGLGSPEPSGDGLTVTAALPELESGVYTVAYQVVSRVDGHATVGTYAFLVDPTGAGAPPADSARERSPSVDPPTLVARWAALAALLFALGAVLLWRLSAAAVLHNSDVDSAPPWSWIATTAVIGAAGVGAYLWLAARPIESAGTGIPFDVAGAYGWTPFAIVMRLTIATAALAGIVAVVAARRGATRPWPAVAGLLGIALAGMSAAGHVAATGGLAFAVIDWCHLIAVAGWLGGLPAAFILSRRARTDRSSVLRSVLRHHGRVAIVAAPLVVLTGIANSPLVLGRARDLVASDYGNLLLAKALLAGVALGIGIVNHLALRGRGRAALGLLVGAELAIAALAVAAAATMVTIQPASARSPVVHPPPVAPAHFSGTLGDLRVHVAVTLPAPGIQSYRVTVGHQHSGPPPADVQKVFIVFTPPAETDLPAERVELAPDELGGLWTASGPYTAFMGEWGLDVVVRRAGVLDESLTFALVVLDPGPGEVGPPPDSGIGVPAALAATWGFLPPGVAGWLAALVVLGALAATWRLRPTRGRDLARGALATVCVVAVLAAGSRALVGAANAPTGADLERQVVEPGSSLDRGRAIYLANCASCHGIARDGDGPVSTVPPAGPLDDAVRTASSAELSYRVAYGVAGTAMPAFAGSLTVAERGDLLAYLRDAAAAP